MRQKARRSGLSIGSVRFSRTDIVMTAPCRRRSAGTNAMPFATAPRGFATDKRSSGQMDLAAVAPERAEQERCDLLASRAEDPGDADDLARMDRERHPVDVRPRELAHVQRRLAALGGGPLRGGADRLAGDHADQRVVVELAAPRVGDDLAVAERDDPVGQVDDLVEAVRDEDDAGAALGDAADRAEELGDLLAVQRGGGLVENEDVVRAGPAVERAGDGDDGPLGGGQARDRDAHVEVGVELRDQLLRVALLLPHGGRQVAAATDAPAEVEVLDRAEGRDQAEVLMDEVEALAQVRAVAESDLRPRVRLVHAGEDLHERRLAGAVVTDDGDDLAGRDAQRDVVQRPHAGERLADARRLEQGATRLRGSPPMARERHC